jgi:hypothetical protein
MSLWGIKINDTFLELPEDAQLNFDADHPAFADDLTSVDYSFPLEIDASGINELVLQIPADFQNARRQFEFPCTIYLFGNPWRSGKFIIDRPGTRKHSGYLVTGIRSLDFLDKKLWEVDLGGDHIVGTTSQDVVDHANSLIDKLYPYAEWCFPTIRSENFYGGENATWEYFINRYDRAAETYLKNSIAVGVGPENKDSLMPCPFYAAVLSRLFASVGYQAEGMWFATDDAQTAFMPGNRPLDIRNDISAKVGTSSPSNVTIADGGNFKIPLDDETTAPYQDPQNRFDPSTGVYGYTIPHAGFYLFKFRHKTTVNSFTGGNMHGLKFEIRANGTPILTYIDGVVNAPSWFQWIVPGQTYGSEYQKIIYMDALSVGNVITLHLIEPHGPATSADVTLENAWMEFRDMDQSGLIEYSPVINLQNHVPDVTVRDFLKYVQIHFGVMFLPDDNRKRVNIILKRYPLESGPSSSIDYAASPDHDGEVIEEAPLKSISFSWPSDDALLSDNFKVPDPDLYLGDGDITAVTPTAEGQILRDALTGMLYVARFDPSNVLQWEYWSDDYQPRIVDPLGKLEIEDHITPLMMRRYDTAVTGDVLVPAMETEAWLPSFNSGGQRTSSLRIANWMSRYVGGVVDEEYPFATSRSAGIAAGSSICRCQIWTDSGDGNNLFDSYRYWYNVLNATVRWNKEFDFNSLDLLSFLEGGMLYMRRVHDTAVLIRRCSFTVTPKRIEPSRLVLLVFNQPLN